MPQPATEHSCSSQHAVRCPIHQTGRPKTRKCPVCGSAWSVTTGIYVVAPWRGDGRYTLDQAVRTFVRRSAAQRWADAQDRASQETHVIRFLAV